MRTIVILLTIIFSSVSFAGEDSVYIGPVQTCTLTSDTNLLLPSIEISFYTTELFGPSETFQVVYKYPALGEAGAPGLAFISLLSTDDVESGVYFGKITNVSYLVDVTYDLTSQTLTMIDDETFVYTGACATPDLFIEGL